jgi:hypothetical protein
VNKNDLHHRPSLPVVPVHMSDLVKWVLRELFLAGRLDTEFVPPAEGGDEQIPRAADVQFPAVQ